MQKNSEFEGLFLCVYVVKKQERLNFPEMFVGTTTFFSLKTLPVTTLEGVPNMVLINPTVLENTANKGKSECALLHRGD